MKKWYESKTLWVNVIAVAGSIFTAVTGAAVSAELVAGSLAIVNILLRFVSSTGIEA